MNKKGFTLVELLAVIAILAILVIIAMPNVLNMFNTAKTNTFVTEVETIYKNAQQQYISDSMTKNAATMTYTDTGSDKIDITTTKHYKVVVDKNGVSTIAVWDESFYFNGAKTVPSTNPANIQKVESIKDIKAAGVKDATASCSTGSNSYVTCN